MSVRVTIEHARQARISGAGVQCAPGIRAWALRNGVDLKRLAHDGIPVEELEHLQDAYAQRAIAIARKAAGQ